MSKLLLKGGRVVDPASGIDGKADVLMARKPGVIIKVGRSIKVDGEAALTKTFYDRLARTTHSFTLGRDNDIGHIFTGYFTKRPATQLRVENRPVFYPAQRIK